MQVLNDDGTVVRSCPIIAHLVTEPTGNKTGHWQLKQ